MDPKPVVIDPSCTAVLTMELQRGVVGDLTFLPELAKEAQGSGCLANAARVVRSGRSAGAAIVHCVVEHRASLKGTSLNAPLLRQLLRKGPHLVEGTPAVEVLPDLHQDGDVVARRHHGLSPFPGTDLDRQLRALGITTIIAVGASLNVGVLGLALVASDLGYRVVVPADAVVAMPSEFGRDLLKFSVPNFAEISSADELELAFSGLN